MTLWSLIKKITVNVKSILSGPGLLKAGLDNPGLVRNLNQQFDDWMLLKITEKIIRENAFEQTPEKQTRVKFNPGLSAIYIYAPPFINLPKTPYEDAWGQGL